MSRRGPQGQRRPHAVPDDPDGTGADLGPCRQEVQVGLSVGEHALRGVLGEQRHDAGDERLAALRVRQVGELDHGRATGAVENVGDEDAVAVRRELLGHLPKYGPQSDGVHVEQYAGVAAAAIGEGEEGVGRTVGGGDIECLAGHRATALS